MTFKTASDEEKTQLDRWVQRLTTATLLALAAGLLGTGIAFYLI